MANDILSGYGRGSSQPQKPSAGCGGVLPGYTKDVMNYSPPVGPKGINDPQSPGIHGANFGNQNGPNTAGSRGGSVGIQSGGGTNRGNSGSQGRY